MLRLLCFSSLIFVSLQSLSQESVRARPTAPEVPGDARVVSKAGIVYVVGAVCKPKGLPIKNIGHLTVLEALAMAEGTKPTADLHKVKIIRKVESGHIEVPVDIERILQQEASDVMLQAEDILFVPRSGARHPTNNFYDVPPPTPVRDTAPPPGRSDEGRQPGRRGDRNSSTG